MPWSNLIRSVEVGIKFSTVYEVWTCVKLDWPMLIEGANLSHSDVTVQDTQQDANLSDEHILLSAGHLSHSNFHDQLHQFSLVNIWGTTRE